MPWTVANQAPLSGDFPGKNTRVDCHSFSRRSSGPRDQTRVCVSCIGRWILHHCTTWEAPLMLLNFTALHGHHFFSPEPQTQMAITRRHLWFKFTSYGRFLLPWLGVSANAVVTRNLSSTLEDIVESAAKAIAVWKNPETLWQKWFLILE